jgi:hypothetical protein
VAHIAEPIEAVIISGPRRGEIIRLPVETLAEIASDADIKMLHEALDTLITAIERLSTEMRATSAAFREPVETA